MNGNFALSKFISTSFSERIEPQKVIYSILRLLILFQLGHALFIAELYAQLCEWKIGTEGGYFHAGGQYHSGQIKFVSAFPASVRFEQSSGPHIFLFNVRLRPEWYGPQKDNYNIQASAGFQYQYRWKEFDFGAGFQGRKQNYHLHTDPININTFQLSASASWLFKKNMTANIESGYMDAVVSGNVRNTVSTRSLSSGLQYFFPGYGSVSGYGYFEAFKAGTDDILTAVKAAKGWRVGPKIGLEYLRKWYITLHYLAAYRHIEYSNRVRPEHEINFVAGKNLTPRWSVFLLVDYYIRDLDSTAGDPVYTQTNYENRVHTKLVYSWKKNYAVYFKLAYSRNEFIYQQITLSGTQASLGFEIQK